MKTMLLIILFSVNAEAVEKVVDTDKYNNTRSIMCMTEALYWEARGANYVNVANLILNRVESNRFPDTVCSVINQKYQFSYLMDTRLKIAYTPYNDEMRKIRKYVRSLLTTPKRTDTTENALFYYNPSKINQPKWASLSNKTVYDGQHMFLSTDVKQHQL